MLRTRLPSPSFFAATLLCVSLAACSGSSSSSSSASSTTYSIGGSISGLTSTGLALYDGTSTGLVINSGTTSYTMTTKQLAGTSYSVTIYLQPYTQDCSISNGSGTMPSANVTNANITCNDVTAYTLGGTITGLTNSGLVLSNTIGTNNRTSTGATTLRSDSLSISAGASSFTFSIPLKNGETYAITVTNPSNQTCSFGTNYGTMGSANVSLALSCS